jgi:hypothetical protein
MSLINPQLIESCVGCAVHQMGEGGFGHKIPSPAGGFTAELSALRLYSLQRDVLFSLIA